MPLGKNIPLLYIYSIFIKRVSMPIIIIYFLLNNLSLTQVGILAAVMAIATIITEIHGGIFADIYGRKLSLALHSVFGILTMFFYFIGNSFEYFLIASITYGLAGAFISGTLGSDLVVEDCIFQNGVAGVGGAISLESIISNIFHWMF